MVAFVRRATVEDLIQMRECNQRCLPEGDTLSMQHFILSMLSWPPINYVAQDPDGRIVGYVLASMEEDDEEQDDKLNGLLGASRRSGLATKLMKATQSAMEEIYKAEEVPLHVTSSNHAALNLFTNTLDYTQGKLQLDNYEDDEAAYPLCKQLKERETIYDQPQHGGGCHRGEEDIGPSKPGSTSGPKAKS